ncbi:unnamed protein product [Paramecium octaurelia]|uniref:Uncharacterized protein n=1 Tax=Paramecium octaurelia TaxID=43137 RepID=A0A8S1WRU9_PAROT|nr:unnamed protein product [Paramecium octaurelia]
MDILVRRSQLIRVNMRITKKLVDGILDIGRMDFNLKECSIQQRMLVVEDQILQFKDLIQQKQVSGETSCFFSKSQVIYKGEYLYGNRIGKWDILFRNEISEQFHLIGGGLYYLREELGSIKGGKWIEITENYGNGIGLSEVIYVGQYQNGKKVGIWVEMRIDKEMMQEGFQIRKQINYNN